MKRDSVFAAVCGAAAAHRLLSAGTLLCAAASVLASLLPPLLLARVIDGLTGGIPLTFAAALLYFGSLALEGVLASAQETLLEILGQKMTHALRAEMSRKLTRLPAATLSAQNPGELAARFSGDVDTVEALFTSGVISMAADACRILSILAVIAVKNAGLALILLPVLPLLAAFTRHVQRRTLAAQMENRRAVAAISAQVPEALHNIRTIRALGLEDYMERALRQAHRGELRRGGEDEFLRRGVFPRRADAQCRGGRRRDAAVGLRRRAGADAVRHVRRHVGCGHQLYLAHLRAD